jgi:uncharacterized protein (DUF1697 family)
MMSETVYVALLRGINVGGHNVKMDALRGHFAEFGFVNVRSYIQSGNVFFESAETDRRKLRDAIETHLQSALGYAVPTCLRTVEELDAVLARDPFRDIEVTPDIRLSVNFLAEPSAIDLPIPFQTSDGAYEVIDKTDSELFVIWRLQNGRPGNSYGQIEKRLKVPVTVRFWHTTAKILAAAKASK